jgi:hypothetical protein
LPTLRKACLNGAQAYKTTYKGNKNMNCPHCGQPVEAGAAFCGNCGQALQATPQPAPGPASISPNSNQSLAGPAATVPAATTGGIVASASPTPSAASPAVPVNRGEMRALIGLIIGVLSIPGALIPIVGCALGIASVVLATMSMQVKRKIAILSLVFGGLGIVLSIILFVYVSTLSQTLVGGSQQTVDTPCFSVKVNDKLHISNTAGSCSLEAYNGTSMQTSTLGLVTAAYDKPSITSSNFETSLHEFSTLLGSSGELRIDSDHAGTFADSPAHYYEATSSNGAKGEIAMVYHETPSTAQNIFLIECFVKDGNPKLAPLEKVFSWK